AAVYFSVVTLTTLGFGDIHAGNWVGSIVVMFEVILGYVMLGLLISILANKVARRA
ncbi:MAG: two pore domain potassium channel family protein, partial [bacterium]|nr:two pore domain potassium channel family protein [bacterium]